MPAEPADRESAEHLTPPHGLKRVLDVFDSRAARIRGPRNCNHVEPRIARKQIVPLEIRQGQPGQAFLFFRADGLGRMAFVVRAASFDLDKYDRATIDGHEIQFTQAPPIAACHDLMAAPAQIAIGGPLAALGERMITAPNGAHA